MSKFLTIITLSIIIACNYKTKLEERVIEGENKIVGFYLNNIANGPFIQYYSDGKIKSLWSMEQGIMVGNSITYFPNGKIKFLKTYENGKFHGFCYSYNISGTLKSKILFLEDNPSYHFYYYNQNGKPYKYEFRGNSNELVFSQEVDTINGKQTLNGDKLIIDDYWINKSNDEVIFMVAKPFGKKQPKIDCYQTFLDMDSVYLIKEKRKSKFGERVYSGLFLDSSNRSKVILTAVYKNGITIKDVLYPEMHN